MKLLLPAILLGRLAATSPISAPVEERAEKFNYDGYRVLRVAFDEYEKNPEAVAALGEQLSDEPPQLGFVDLLVAPEKNSEVESLAINAQVIQDDLGAAIKQEEEETVEYRAGAVPSDSWFDAYHSYADHLAFLTDLVSVRPSNAEIVYAGTSSQGRNITGIHFWGSSGKNTKPAVIMHSTVHAREWITTLTNEYVAYQLLTKYASDATIKSYVDKYDFYVFPVVNPDGTCETFELVEDVTYDSAGFVYTQTNTRLWRKNRQSVSSSTCIGTDINRNWAVGWNVAGGSSTDPCDETYRGTAALSAPETSGLAAFSRTVASRQGVKMYMDWHSYSQLWMTPYGYTCSQLPSTNTELQSISGGAVAAIEAVHGTQFEYGPICQTIYQASGSSVDYSHQTVGSQYTFTAELRDTGRYGFVLPANQIRPTSEEMWAGMSYVFANMK
ncbi:putative carboxypeptidase a1 precursor protein [Neofusicoccum parvum UCRNP2]|uniref:Putative carboxypeptidase a1 protein n=1 Tax=Botryosphaeria parva (strain UCR-NP2) TaxID=1287680 RepID=R1G2T0_BOTPV|nr:putative carboxypeptidase a1 precursor protein [Neofusicoccum parvum UCRNP2]